MILIYMMRDKRDVTRKRELGYCRAYNVVLVYGSVYGDDYCGGNCCCVVGDLLCLQSILC